MGTNTGHVMTLANSIIGVSVLAMPFCFKQCGIILATLMLIASSIMTRLACYYLIKSSILARRRNFEFLAFHTFGPTGKLMVELSIIGFMLGTCVAFFVVMGDLGPAIVGPMFHVDNPTSIRASVLIAIAVFVVLPLGLLRNVDSLAAISVATIAFYICLVLKVMGEATTHLVAWDWLDKVHLWRPAGLLQCIPIFSMALSCQTQLFEIFDSIPNATLDKMNVIVRSAVNLCTIMYITMGIFGYIAFCTQPFSGNLMLSFSPTPTSEVIKMGFVLSVAVSFPLVIFPCRASLHSLLFRKGVPPHYELLSVSNHMPEHRFKLITLVIVIVSLVTGVLIPNIELVLGLVGSTIGVLVCVIVPATLFLHLTSKNNNERLLAQILFGVGVLIMVLGSYANLYATEEAITSGEVVLAQSASVSPPSVNLLPSQNQHNSKSKVEIKDDALKEIKNINELAAALPQLIQETPAPAPAVAVAEMKEKADVRKEPPVPEAPMDKVVSASPMEVKKEKTLVAAVKQTEVIHNDAIKKEDDEIKEVQKQDILKKKEELIEKLEETEQKQQKLLEEQKKILQDIKLEKKKLVEEGQQLESLDNMQNKPKKEDKVYIQNDILIQQKENLALEIKEEPDLKNKNMPDIVEIPNINKVENNKVKSMNIMKDDIVKKNMADGIPIPIVGQNIAPNIDLLKSVKIVENPANANEGNADAKVIRREILENSEVKEQREKRDLELIKMDLKDMVDMAKDNTIHQSGNIVVEAEISTIGNSILLNKVPSKTTENENKVETNKNDQGKVKLSSMKEAEKPLNVIPKQLLDNSLIEKGNEKEHCLDEKKENNIKFSDSLKLLKGKGTLDEKEIVPIEEKSQIIEKVDINPLSKSSKVSITQKETTESIIKSPNYLSNPGLVLTGNGKLPLEINVLNGIAKPMKRDLKSITIENKKEKET